MELDLDAIEAEPCITTTNGGQKPLVLLHVDKRDALVAEVRRLRAEVAEARKSTENAIAELRMGRTHHASTLRALWDCQEEADRG